jgi:hypothetical protein
MSIETLTGDDFMNLDSPTHRVALAQYEQAVDASLREVTLLPGGPARTQELEHLTEPSGPGQGRRNGLYAQRDALQARQRGLQGHLQAVKRGQHAG